MFPHLQHIDIRSIEPASQPHLIEFVQQHHAAFPGVLSKLAIAVYNVDHGFSIALLKSFGDSLRDLEIYNWPWQIDFLSDGGQIAVPERLERLILPINMHPLWDFDKYLDRLERLETLGVSVERDFIFKDAQNRKLTKQELPLRRLRHLRLRSYTSRTNLMTALENAIFAYKDQLESLVVDPLFLPLNRDEMVSWAEPEAFSLAFDGPVPAGLPISNITTVPNPNQGILLNTGNNQEAPIDITVPNLLNPRLTHVFVKTYMPALRVLHLNDMIAMHFSMWSLAACPALESLTLDISNSIRTLYSHENEALLGRTGNWSMCCVPNLRELHLRGPWRIPYRTLNAMVTQQQVDVILSDPVVAAGDTAMPVSSRNRARPDRKHYARRHPLRKLEVLDASGAQALTAMEIGRLVGKLPSLREIIVAVEADEKDNLSLWTKEHGGLVDVRSFIRTFESEYDTPM
ncbi:hypothetical protein BGZ73_007875 [Actinomortierella ambigua]|nr:hypothetical protein BGZ73_007875 [Actinomortierella ambigua]